MSKRARSQKNNSQAQKKDDVPFERVGEKDRKAVEEYSAKLPTVQRKIVSSLIQTIWETAPDSKLSIKWNQPVFEQNGPFCYIRAFKDHVNLGFWRGASLSTGKRLLETSGTKMAHVKIKNENDIPKENVKEWVKEAVRLNEKYGDPTKRK